MKVVKSLKEWRDLLSPQAFHVLFEKGTEPPFQNAYHDEEGAGEYRCGACDSLLFSSNTKYHSGSGWPSFFEAVQEGAVETRPDRSHGMIRTEVVCATCGGHLGHLFPDGPPPTGQRYCMNSAALRFVPDEQD